MAQPLLDVCDVRGVLEGVGGGGRAQRVQAKPVKLECRLIQVRRSEGQLTNGVANAGVANFTKQFAGYAARHNITVNCVHPGFTATERVTQIFEREAKETDTEIDAVIAKRTGDIPLGKLIQPEDIASAVLFFCSPMANMVTGQCIAVDGGSGQAVIY